MTKFEWEWLSALRLEYADLGTMPEGYLFSLWKIWFWFYASLDSFVKFSAFSYVYKRLILAAFIMFEQWQHFCYGVHEYYHDFITLYGIQSNRLFLNSFLLEFGSGIWLYYCFYGKKIIPNHWNLVKSVNGIYGDIIFTVMWICPLFIKFFTVHFFPS